MAPVHCKAQLHCVTGSQLQVVRNVVREPCAKSTGPFMLGMAAASRLTQRLHVHFPGQAALVVAARALFIAVVTWHFFSPFNNLIDEKPA
jgi:hypothetical protein